MIDDREMEMILNVSRINADRLTEASLASKVVSIYLAAKFMKLLSTPWKETPAFKQGIVDDTGKRLVSQNKLTSNQKEVYGSLDRVFYNIKRMSGTFGIVSAVVAKKLLEDGTAIYLDEIENEDNFVNACEAVQILREEKNKSSENIDDSYVTENYDEYRPWNISEMKYLTYFEMPNMIPDNIASALTDSNANKKFLQSRLDMNPKKLSKFNINYITDGKGSYEFFKQKDDKVVYFAVFEVIKNHTVQSMVWRDKNIKTSLPTDIFRYMRDKNGGIVSDLNHTGAGKKFWLREMQTAIDSGFTVGTLTDKFKLDETYDREEPIKDWANTHYNSNKRFFIEQ